MNTICCESWGLEGLNQNLLADDTMFPFSQETLLVYDTTPSNGSSMWKAEAPGKFTVNLKP